MLNDHVRHDGKKSKTEQLKCWSMRWRALASSGDWDCNGMCHDLSGAGCKCGNRFHVVSVMRPCKPFLMEC